MTESGERINVSMSINHICRYSKKIYVRISHFLTDGFLSVYFIEDVLSLCLREDFFIELLRFCCEIQENFLF